MRAAAARVEAGRFSSFGHVVEKLGREDTLAQWWQRRDGKVMYLRRIRRGHRLKTYEYWSLVQTVRTPKGPRQRHLATLGKLPGQEAEARVGWDEVGRQLAGRPVPPDPLFDPGPPVPEWATVGVRDLRLERVRDFGDVYLALAMWRRLGLDEALAALPLAGREEIPWATIACLLTIGRVCAPSSELAVAEKWYPQTALEDLLGVPVAKVNDDRLYRALDHLLPHKDAICKHLQARYEGLFGVTCDFLLYDVTSTYFEGEAKRNPLAKRGYSRDHRSECAQVCLGLVVTPEGLPVGYEVFAGNRPDVTTLEQMLDLLEHKYGKARRVWVFDRGIASEANLQLLRERGAQYLCGTPKALLKQYAAELQQDGWEELRADLEVKLVAAPEGDIERFVLCRSADRAQKERAMLDQQIARLDAKLSAIQHALRGGKLTSRDTAQRRLGHWLGKYPRAAALLSVAVVSDGARLTDLQITRKPELEAWARLAHGAYLLRTNTPASNPKELWQRYMQLNQAEQAFHLCKSDLDLRPVYHQIQPRVEAHILICFLALALWRSLEHALARSQLGTCARQVLATLREVRMLDVVLPLPTGPALRLRVVTRPDTHAQILLHFLGLQLPNQPKRIADVVANTAHFQNRLSVATPLLG